MKRKLPELLLEATMIFFAVLLALGAEEWRESRDRNQLAERALRGVIEELRSNRDEMETTGNLNLEALEAAQFVLAELEAGRDQGEVGIGLDVALLSSAAWHSAQMSQAVQYLDLDVMRRLSEAYEVQDLYDRMQTAAVDRMTEIMSVAEQNPAAAVGQGIVSLRILTDLHEDLIATYSETLADLDPGDGTG